MKKKEILNEITFQYQLFRRLSDRIKKLIGDCEEYPEVKECMSMIIGFCELINAHPVSRKNTRNELIEELHTITDCVGLIENEVEEAKLLALDIEDEDVGVLFLCIASHLSVSLSNPFYYQE